MRRVALLLWWIALRLHAIRLLRWVSALLRRVALLLRRITLRLHAVGLLLLHMGNMKMGLSMTCKALDPCM